MYSALIAFAIALCVSVALTPLVRKIAREIGVVDEPGGRRVHRGAIPRLGGVAIALSFFVPLLIMFGFETQAAGVFFSDPLRIVGLAVGGVLLGGTGVVDDIRGVRAWHKLWAQTAAAALAFACGFRIEAVSLPLFGYLDMGVFALPVTMLWIVAIINAVNLIDGLDGLAGGVTFFACIANFAVAAVHQDASVMLLSAALGGAVMGFLLFNFNPATIFMGDSGSLFLGYVIATTSLLGASVKSSTTVAILAPLIALGLPIADTLFAMLRRFLERRPIFSPDDGHIHHRLLRMGLTHRRAVLTLYGLSIVFTTSAIIVAIGRDWQVGAVLVLLTLVVFGLVRSVGNFQLAIRRWQRGARTWASDNMHLLRAVRAAVQALSVVESEGQVRAVLRALKRDGRLAGMELRSPLPQLAFHDAVEGREEDYVRATYDLTGAGDAGALFVSWISPTNEVQAEVDVLLHMVAESVSAALEDMGAAVVSRRPSRGQMRPN